MVVLGRTGIRSGKNGFGALPIQRVAADAAVRLLRGAYDAGITFFDTARAYSDSERKIGAALSGVRGDIVIATKTASRTAEGFWKDLHTSLDMLKTGYIDIYQFHGPESCPLPGDGSGLYEAMTEAKGQGKIRFIGITSHRRPVAEEAVKSGAYDTLQFPLSYLSDAGEIALTELCRQKDVGFIAMKALAGGLITRADAAYAWIDAFDSVLPIWGIERERELDEFLGFAKDPPAMTEGIKAVIERDRVELAGNFCRGCGYCMPVCPAKIHISLCARMIRLIRRSPSAHWLSDEGRAMMGRIAGCEDCGQCKSHCPYELDTPALLRQNLADYNGILAGEVAPE
ncbi:MAG: aldo/keto reductase [Oscillospiraceae bacterium]|nr:aldo/keto reductase [Oscillospiraceae bacterium]